jgi:hypothetical protein
MLVDLISRSLHMTLRFGLTATLVMVGCMTLLAQSHEGTHPQGPPHGPHDPIDPQLHAAMHSLVGTWTGTLGSTNGPELMHLVAANDSDGHLTLKLKSDSARFGPASDVALKGNAVRWMQVLAGASCRASASFAAPKEQSPETLKGTLTCAGTRVPFTLEKQKK